MNATTAAPETALVDTSLLVELQKMARCAEPVRNALNQFRFTASSSYAKLEFKRAWLKRLAWLHNRASQASVETVADLMDEVRISFGKHHLARRRYDTTVQAIMRFLESAEGTLSEEAVLVRFLAHLRTALRDSQKELSRDRGVTAYLDGTGCVRAREPVEYSRATNRFSATIRRCRRSTINCRIHEFFREHQERFDAIVTTVGQQGQASTELRVAADTIREAGRDPACLCDDRVCSRIADAIAAVDGRDMQAYAANNDAEWQVLASTFGKPLINPVRDHATQDPR